MKVISSFVLLLTAVTVFASDSLPAETQQVLYLADAGVVVLRLSVVVVEGSKQCHEEFVDSVLKQNGWPCFGFPITEDVPRLDGFGTSSAKGEVAWGLHCFCEDSATVGQLPIRCVESEVVSPGLPVFNCVYGQARRLPYVFQQAANMTTALGDGRLVAYSDFRQAVCWRGRS